MSEASMRTKVTGALRRLDAVAVENRVMSGTPDVNFIGGWLELKWVRAWPVKPETPLLIPHYTIEQKAWGIRRMMRGGYCGLLLQVRAQWLLFDAVTAAACVGKSNREVLTNQAQHVWMKGLDKKELLIAIWQNLELTRQ